MPSTRHIVSVVFFAACVFSFTSLDQFWHLKSGQVMLEEGRVLTKDPFSHTRAGANWVAHSYGGACAMALVHRLGGFGLLQVLKALLFLSFLKTVMRLCRLRGGRAGFINIVMLACALAFTCRVVVARPKAITVLFVALQELTVFRSNRDGNWRRLALLPIMYLCWANLHGGFVVGLALLGAHLLGACLARERFGAALFLALGFSGAAGLLNPRGLELYLYPFQYLPSSSFASYIKEWQPMTVSNSPVQLACVILLVVAFFKSDWSWRDLTTTALSLFLAVRFQRNEYLLAATLLPAATGGLCHLLDWPQQRYSLLAAFHGGRRAWLYGPLLVLSLWAIAVGPTGGWVAQNPLLCPKAIEHMKTHEYDGKLINDFALGGYLIYELWPQYRVFIDGRNDFYHRDGVFGEYLSLLRGGARTRQVLDKYDCRTAIVAPRSRLLSCIEGTGQWRQVYADGHAIVLVR